MRIGYWHLAAADGVAPAELGRELAERGAEALFLGEHTNLPVADAKPDDEQDRLHPRIADPLITLTAVAAATENLTLGTSILLAAQREPIVTAKAIATLDVLSGGRVVLGVGAGWHAGELASHGVDPRARAAVLREHMLAMRAIWTRDQAEFHGTHVDFGPLYSWPKPVSGPVVLAGGGLEPAWRKVREYADGWLPVFPGEAAPLVADIAEMRHRAAEAGRDLPVTVMNAPADVAALAVLAEAGVDRVLLELPRAGADGIRRALDGHVDLLGRTW
jgi:probable F420-dependent oxidoreductase